MPRVVSFLKYWLPVILWLAVIFFASGDSLSSQRTSQFIGPLLHWLFPAMSDATMAEVIFGIRKAAHMMEYAVLALLIWRAYRKPLVNDPRPWSRLQARRALFLSILYAGTDEFHQMFVPSREARIHDVALDACGALGALFLLWLLGRWKKDW